MRPMTFYSDPDTDLATTNDYVTVPVMTGIPEGGKQDYLAAETSGPISVNWKNTGAESIDYRVLGSNDKDSLAADRKVVDTGTILTGAVAHVEIPIAYYQFYWFQHTATVDGSQGASNLHGRFSRI